MSKNLYIVVGLPGSGKSTYLTKMKTGYIVSRDTIRLSLLDENASYFDNEKLVFNEFVYQIQNLLNSSSYVTVFADATHINQKSRNKLLNKLNLKNTNIHIIYIDTPVDICIKRNSKREGLEKVPEEVIRDFYNKLEIPSHNEKYKYKSISIVRNF